MTKPYKRSPNLTPPVIGKTYQHKRKKFAPRPEVIAYNEAKKTVTVRYPAISFRPSRKGIELLFGDPTPRQFDIEWFNRKYK